MRRAASNRYDVRADRRRRQRQAHRHPGRRQVQYEPQPAGTTRQRAAGRLTLRAFAARVGPDLTAVDGSSGADAGG